MVELMVGIAILLVVATITVLFFPSMQDQARGARGASLLQGWLQIAKTQALRDQAPRGLRLHLIDMSTAPDEQQRKVSYKPGRWVVDCQIIEQPPDVVSGMLEPTNATTVKISSVSGFVAGSPDLWPVQIGDYVEFPGGTVRRISAVTRVDDSTAFLTVATGVPGSFTTSSTGGFRIVRAPRVTGEEVLQLPQDVAIDLTTNATYPLPAVTDASGNIIGYDILFAPSGMVISRNFSGDFLPMWVRDVNGTLYSNEATIIAVHGRTGAIVAGPPDQGADPYSFVR